MTKLLKVSFAAACAALLALPSGPARADAAGDLAATVISVRPQVRLIRAEAERPLELGMFVRAGDRVRTDESGVLRLVLVDGSSFAIGPNSDFTAQSLGANGGGGSVFSLVKGMLQGAVRHLSGGQRLIIQTPTGVAAVKGTEYQVSALEDKTELKVLKGDVELSDPAGHGSVDVGPGQAAESYLDRVTAARRMNRDEVEALRKAFLVQVRQAQSDYLRRVRALQPQH
jgi:hypothetical protein